MMKLLAKGDTWVCKDHPRYQVRRQPRRACAGCWILWFDQLGMCFLAPPERPDATPTIDPNDFV